MSTTGTCEDMCSRSECTFRIRNQLVHALEMKNNRPCVLVKEYRRSAAGRETTSPKHLRTAKALLKTVNYLINEICTDKHHEFPLVYEFVFDRLRAVRQDLVIQSIHNDTTVYILEQCVQFYLTSSARLKSAKTPIYDDKINTTQLEECLKQLLVLYRDLADQGEDHLEERSSLVTCKHRAEFESIYILFNLGHPEALRHHLDLPVCIRQDKNCKSAWEFNMAVYEKNFVRAFRIMENFTELMLVAVNSHLLKISEKAQVHVLLSILHKQTREYNSMINREFLHIMNTGFSSKACRYPLRDLSKLIPHVNAEDLTVLLARHSVTVEAEVVRFLKTSWTS